MIYSESILSRIQTQGNNNNNNYSTLKSKIASFLFMTTGLASGIYGVVILLQKSNIL